MQMHTLMACANQPRLISALADHELDIARQPG
jgi:hypothetical protein